MCVAQLGLPPADYSLDVIMEDEVEKYDKDDIDTAMDVDAPSAVAEEEPVSVDSSNAPTMRTGLKAWCGSFIPTNQEIDTNPLKWM